MKSTTTTTVTHERHSSRTGAWNGSNWIRKARRFAIYQRDGFSCQYCGQDVSATGDYSQRATLDHIIPPSKGGTHDSANLRTACRPCNASKGDN